MHSSSNNSYAQAARSAAKRRANLTLRASAKLEAAKIAAEHAAREVVLLTRKLEQCEQSQVENA